MQLSLRRLRLGFLLLAVSSVVALGLLVKSALERMARQRALRHEVVAERIFDELERELSAHHELESARPSQAYDAPSSRADAWAPFVVGYFVVDERAHVVSREQLSAARVARIEQVVASRFPAALAIPRGDARGRAPAEHDLERSQAALASEPRAPELKQRQSKVQQALPQVPQSSPEVLRRLKRTPEPRKQSKQDQLHELTDPFGF